MATEISPTHLKFPERQNEYTTQEMANKIATFLLEGPGKQLFIYATQSFWKFSIDDVHYQIPISSSTELIQSVKEAFFPPRPRVQFKCEESTIPFDDCSYVGRFFLCNYEEVAQDIAELAYVKLQEKRAIEIDFHEKGKLTGVTLNGVFHEVDARGNLIERIEQLAQKDFQEVERKKPTLSAGLFPSMVVCLELKDNTHGSARN